MISPRLQALREGRFPLRKKLPLVRATRGIRYGYVACNCPFCDAENSIDRNAPFPCDARCEECGEEFEVELH